MDVGKSFSYPFQDEKWLTKLFIGAVVSVVPILNFAWAGYMVDLVKNVMGNVALPLPEWSDFGGKFVKGLILWVAGLIYAIPFLCLSSALFIPLMGATSDAQNVQEAMAAAFTGIGIVVACLMALYGLALTFYFPAMFINFARKGSFGACFQIGEIFKVVSHDFGKYITAWLVSLVAGLVVGFVVSLLSGALSLIPCLGWIVGWIVGGIGTVYISTIYGHLFGQVAAGQSTAMEPASM